ncbi:MAG: flagellar basal body-associated FliL family protein [Thermacetogeniaceae bacterium]|jgi:flagellar FliL protein|nr:flagellar basal body-associated FliL family protein [Thermoanaerobacterales bacterium]
MAEPNSDSIMERQGKEIVINQKVLIFGCAAIALCAVIALFAVYMALRSGANYAGGNNRQTSAAQIGPLFELGELTTNLASGGEKKYVKVNIVFELNDKSLEKEIKEKLPVLSDRIIVLLNSKKSDDLSAENRAKLKNEILSNLNTVLTTGKLEDIYFSDLVMQ